MELSNLQKEILAHDEDVLFVEASAAAGKTAVLTARARDEIARKKGTVVLFTFTRAAAEEMRKRTYVTWADDVFIGTIHSYCLSLLLSKGITEASNYCEEEQFDKLFSLIQKHPECIRPVYCILCDEAQDCNKDQFNFIFDMIRAQRYFLVFDKRQSIYRWRGSEPELLDEYAEKLDATICSLNENYRNASEILQYAQSIIEAAGVSYYDRSVPMRQGGQVIIVAYSAAAIAKTIKRRGHYKDWFVLTRTNQQLEDFAESLRQFGVPYTTFKRSDLNGDELAEKMEEDSVKLLTIHASKGLEAKNVVVIGARFYNTEEKCIDYVAATRAKDLLVWTEMPNNSYKKARRQIENWEY